MAAHYLFNVTDGDRQHVRAHLRARRWGVGRDERHRDALGAGDLALVYLAAAGELVARVELATAVHEWTQTSPGDSPSGVLLSQVEEWDPAVSMAAVVQRIDPTRSNPIVQANAATGFRAGVVLITADEYEAVVALAREE